MKNTLPRQSYKYVVENNEAAIWSCIELSVC